MAGSYQKYSFENLEVYQLAEELVINIYKITEKFPSSEMFGLTSQLKRASISVALNLAEGATERSNKDFARFIGTALGSLVETKAALRIGEKLGFVSEEALGSITPFIDKIFFKTIALKKAVTK